MSQEAVTQIVTKALNDSEFREQLFDHPDTALAGFELTEEERNGLSGLTREEFDAYATDIEERLSKGGLFGGVIGHHGAVHEFLNPQPEPPA